jgi:hypothetical protein
MSTSNMALLVQKQTGRWNQKHAIKTFLNRYNIKFDVESDAIDLRTMAKNYPNEIIPLEDIHRGVLSVLGPNYDPILQPSYDPSHGVPMFPRTPVSGAIAPQFGYFDWNELYLFSIFQRDVAPNHCAKLYKDWDHSSVLIPCAIKFTLQGVVYVCIWDGHHTLQVMRTRNYSKFPVWYIDVDTVPMSTIVGAGFSNDENGKVAYGCWIAGHNMIRINSTNKRPLAHYDRFMILFDTKDARAMAIHNIIQATGCIVKRNAKLPGSWTQINSGEECYDLKLGNGQDSKGIFWRHALEFHRKVWPMAPLELEVFRPMSYLYQAFDINNCPLDANFDIELANILTSKYGPPESVQLAIKDSYYAALGAGAGRGTVLSIHKEIVTAGLINLYNQNCGRLKVLPPADYVWSV